MTLLKVIADPLKQDRRREGTKGRALSGAGSMDQEQSAKAESMELGAKFEIHIPKFAIRN